MAGGMRIGGNVEKTAAAAAKRRNKRIDEITAANLAAKEAGTEVAKGQLDLNKKTQADAVTQKGLDRKHETGMQTARFGHETGMQKDQQRFLGGENTRRMRFDAGENALNRTAKATESAAQRSFIGGENALDRTQKTEEGQLAREHDLIKQGREITGKAFIGGVSGDKVQQMENSASTGNLNYAGVNVPQAETRLKPWQQMVTTNDDGTKAVTGSFNTQTGERKVFLGGMDPTNPSADQLSYLKELKMKDPAEYERIKQQYRMGAM